MSIVTQALSSLKRISLRDVLALTVCAGVATAILVFLPSGFRLSQDFRIHTQRLLAYDIETAIDRTRPLFQNVQADCRPQSDDEFRCVFEVNQKKETRRLSHRLQNLRPLGWVAREELIQRMEDELKSVENTRSQMSELNTRIASQSDALQEASNEEAVSLRNKKQQLDQAIDQLNAQLKMLEEALPSQEDPERQAFFTQKIDQVKSDLNAKQAALRDMLPEYQEKASAFLSLDALETEKSALKESLDLHLVVATRWEEYLQSRPGQSPLPDPEDFQVSTRPGSLKVSTLYDRANLWYVLPLAFLLFGLWRKIDARWLRPTTPVSRDTSEAHSPVLSTDETTPSGGAAEPKQTPNEDANLQRIAAALNIPHLGDLS